MGLAKALGYIYNDDNTKTWLSKHMILKMKHSGSTKPNLI